MVQKKRIRDRGSPPAARRRFNRSIAAGLSLPFLPESWLRPVVRSVILPAHAQTSSEEDREETSPVEDGEETSPVEDGEQTNPCGEIKLTALTVAPRLGDMGDTFQHEAYFWVLTAPADLGEFKFVITRLIDDLDQNSRVLVASHYPTNRIEESLDYFVLDWSMPTGDNSNFESQAGVHYLEVYFCDEFIYETPFRII